MKKEALKLRVIAFFIVCIITYLSNTSGLIISDISTWLNPASYENVTIYDVFKKGSVFYSPWSDVRDLEFYLHKMSHFIFFGMLTLCLFWGNKGVKKFILKFVLIFGFALIDEIHQFFIVGRSGRLADVIFDMFGVMCFLFLITIVLGIRTLTYRKLSYRK
ncbi:VanZ family protein [Bacillus sp. Brlt_9]|uniref:VanZ family protein n=1 Tax=Bacillus sp. Brlt_9 TaxID=3110916 RepID=UPI003F7B3BA9